MTKAVAKKLRIESFRPGTHTSSDGTKLTFSADEVRAIATGYDADNSPAPIVVGHPKTDDPAFGWCASFTYDEDRERLIADTGELAPAFADSVAAGHYKKVSMALFAPDHPANPKPGQWYPRHLGFLGAAPPAVTGLKPVTFSDDGTKVIEVEFAASGWAIKDLFSRMRDYWIDKFGLEEADKAMPSYLIESCDSPPPSTEQPYYAALPQEIEPMPAPTTTTPAPAANAAELTAAQTRIAELETQLKDQRAAAAKTSAAEFCAGLVEAKRLLPADRPALEAALVAIDASAPVEFDAGDGAKKSEAPSAVIRRLLGAKNPLVSGVETTAAVEEPITGASFSAPGGMKVDPKDAAVHAKAKAYQAQHAGMDFATALRAVVAG